MPNTCICYHLKLKHHHHGVLGPLVWEWNSLRKSILSIYAPLGIKDECFLLTRLRCKAWEHNAATTEASKLKNNQVVLDDPSHTTQPLQQHGFYQSEHQSYLRNNQVILDDPWHTTTTQPTSTASILSIRIYCHKIRINCANNTLKNTEQNNNVK